MRTARDGCFLKSEAGQLVGISLGADFVSEHEWGIKELLQAFGVSGNGYGIERRQIHKVPTIRNWKADTVDPGLHLFKNKESLVLLAGTEKPSKNDHYCLNSLSRYKEDPRLITAWDSKSFGISVHSADDKEALKRIHEAAVALDLAIWVGRSGAFQNGGLVLAIVSQMSPAQLKAMSDQDMEAERLQDAARTTQISERLTQAGKRWFALSPKWRSPEDKLVTNYPVIYWLNPQEQNSYNSGWYTVEELDQWANNTGPIVKKAT